MHKKCFHFIVIDMLFSHCISSSVMSSSNDIAFDKQARWAE